MPGRREDAGGEIRERGIDISVVGGDAWRAEFAGEACVETEVATRCVCLMHFRREHVHAFKK